MVDESELQSEFETSEGYSEKIISMKSILIYVIKMRVEPERSFKKINSFNKGI